MVTVQDDLIIFSFSYHPFLLFEAHCKEINIISNGPLFNKNVISAVHPHRIGPVPGLDIGAIFNQEHP